MEPGAPRNRAVPAPTRAPSDSSSRRRIPHGTGQYPVAATPVTLSNHRRSTSTPSSRTGVPAAAAAAVGPDGIDWEAEAAALEAQSHAPLPPEEAPVYQEHPSAAAHEGGYADEYAEEEEYQPFLAAEDDSRSGARRRKQQGRSERKRSGGACLTMSLLMVVALGGVGYGGYGVYEHFMGPPADYAGSGTGSVSVIVKDGDVGTNIGQTLKADGVVTSVQAFVDAYTANNKAQSIQPGTYTMPKKMSAAAAVDFLVKANGGDALIVPEGLQAAKVYPLIDTKLGLAKGTTAAAAKAEVASLGLPAFAQRTTSRASSGRPATRSPRA